MLSKRERYVYLDINIRCWNFPEFFHSLLYLRFVIDGKKIKGKNHQGLMNFGTELYQKENQDKKESVYRALKELFSLFNTLYEQSEEIFEIINRDGKNNN